VLGFPCNQFGAQEPGTDAEIKAFAQVLVRRMRSTNMARARLLVAREQSGNVHATMQFARLGSSEPAVVSLCFPVTSKARATSPQYAHPEVGI
jgi:hypothetical protein